MVAVGIYAKVAKENGTELPFLSHDLPFSTCYMYAGLLGLSLERISCFTDVVDTLATDPALLLLTVGSLTFIVTFLGCFGALRDGAVLLKMVRLTIGNALHDLKQQPKGFRSCVLFQVVHFILTRFDRINKHLLNTFMPLESDGKSLFCFGVFI